jgi:hypothetical protein
VAIWNEIIEMNAKAQLGQIHRDTTEVPEVAKLKEDVGTPSA